MRVAVGVASRATQRALPRDLNRQHRDSADQNPAPGSKYVARSKTRVRRRGMHNPIRCGTLATGCIPLTEKLCRSIGKPRRLVTSNFSVVMHQFAELPDRWENASMQKLIKIMGIIVVAGFILAGNAGAQQTPASNPPKTPPAKGQAPASAKTPEPAPAKAPAAKTGQATAPRKASAGKTVTLTTPKDKASYAIGMNIGNGLHRDSVDVDPNILLEGLKVTLAGGKGLLTDEEAK